jgi:hypothetical protein
VVSSDPEVAVLELGKALDAERVELRMVTPTDLRRLQWAIDLGQLPAPSGPLRAGVRGPDVLAHDVRVEPQHLGLLDALLADAVGERATIPSRALRAARPRALRVDGDLFDVSHYRLRTEQLAGIVNAVRFARASASRVPRAPGRGAARCASAGACSTCACRQPSLHGG